MTSSVSEPPAMPSPPTAAVRSPRVVGVSENRPYPIVSSAVGLPARKVTSCDSSAVSSHARS